MAKSRNTKIVLGAAEQTDKQRMKWLDAFHPIMISAANHLNLDLDVSVVVINNNSDRTFVGIIRHSDAGVKSRKKASKKK